MMLTHAAPPIYRPQNRTIPRWRLEALTRAWEWSRAGKIPYTPYLAVKAL